MSYSYVLASRTHQALTRKIWFNGGLRLRTCNDLFHLAILFAKNYENQP